VSDHPLYVPLRDGNLPKPPVLSLLVAALPLPSGWEAQPSTAAPNTDGTSMGASLDTRWTGGFSYRPRNNLPGWLRDVCDNTTVDAPALAAPEGASATPSATGGDLVGGTEYTYVVTFVDANGETTDSTPVTATIPGEGSAGSVVVSGWVFPEDYVARGITAKVYGRIGGSLGLLAQGLTTDSYTDTGSASPGAAVPSSNTTGGPGTYTNLGWVNFKPYLIVVEDTCSAFGFEAHDFKTWASDLLDLATPAAVGKEFWHGYFAQAQGLPNDYLTNPDTVVDLTPGTVPSIARGQQILEDALAQTGGGGPGMIHCTPDTAPSFIGARRTGPGTAVSTIAIDTWPGDPPLLLTTFDNIVVPDPGYDGLGPDNATPAAGTEYMYATDLVSAAVDTPVVIPDSFEEALDRGVNTITFRAERYAAATFDGARHFACRVNKES